MIVLSLLLTLFFSLNAYGEQIPNYNDPFSPILTDQPIYTWTDKVRITIIAPSWNAEKDGIDSIGTQQGNFIKISTREHFIEPYKLSEIDPRSGKFVGEITLTGFLHDADGDGIIDTNPQTSGTGPTNGFLQADRDDAITISFEFADGVVVLQSVPISWNIAKSSFEKPQYQIDDSTIIRITDFDMNLNPENLDQIPLQVSSDSDLAGILVDAIETQEESGVFEAKISFTQTSESSGNRLFVVPGDTIYSLYEDHTLPKPYSKDDSLDIASKSILLSNIPLTERITIENVFFADSLGNPINELKQNSQSQIVGAIINNQDYTQEFVLIFQITDSKEKIVSLSWVTGELNPKQTLELSQSWTPTKSDDFTVETFVWKSFDNPQPLSIPHTNFVSIS